MENLVIKISGGMANVTWTSNLTDEDNVIGTDVEVTSNIDATLGGVSLGIVLRVLIHVVLIIVGLMFNGFVVAVYSRKSRKSTYLMVTALAVCDILNCVGQSLEIVKLLGLKDSEMAEMICFVRHGYVCFMTMLTAGLVMFVAVDRYLKIKYYRSVIRLSRKHCLWFIFGVLLTSTLVTSPFFVTHGTDVLPRTGFCLGKETKGGRVFREAISPITDGHVTEINRGLLTGNRDLFLFIFYVILLLCISASFLVTTTLYVKLGRLLMKKSPSKRSSIASSREDSDVSLCTTDDESSCNSENTSKKSRFFRKYRVGFTGDLTRVVNEKAVINKLQTQINNDECLELGNISDIPPSVRTSTPKREQRRPSGNDVTFAHRRKSTTLSIGSTQKSSGQYSRTIFMISMAIMLFLFYYASIATYLLNVLNRDMIHRFPLIFEITENIQVTCYIFNPVIYAFFNRGFARRMRTCCLGNGL